MRLYDLTLLQGRAGGWFFDTRFVHFYVGDVIFESLVFQMCDVL